MNVLLKRTGCPFEWAAIDNTLETMQKLVGGYIETVALQDQLDDVIELCKENPRLLKTADVARILGMNPEGLRCAIDAGKCPFGLSWQKEYPWQPRIQDTHRHVPAVVHRRAGSRGRSMTFLQMPDGSYLNMDRVEYLTVREYEKDFGRGPEKVFGVAAYFPSKTIFLCSFDTQREAATLLEEIITELRKLEGVKV